MVAYPQVNVSVDGYNILFKKHINIGVAVSLNDGNLIVPVIHDADRLNLNGLALSINSLALKARNNKLTPDEISGGTFTITNYGTFKMLFGTPVINQPEAERGKWAKVFGNSKPIHIEIGMGKGQFLLNMALAHPDVNYIGIERYSSVLLRAVEKFDRDEYRELENIRFVCMDAKELDKVFAPEEVDKIYLNFSDPWPKARHAKRRLTSKEFLKRYEDILVQHGKIEFKTDNTELFNFSLEQVEEAEGWELLAHTFDLHHNEEMNKGNIMTEYEAKFSAKGQPINKLIATRK